MKSIDLQNRTTTLTGSTCGIDRAIAHRRLTSGARVSLWALDDAARVTWLCSEDCPFTTPAVSNLSGGRATY